MILDKEHACDKLQNSISLHLFLPFSSPFPSPTPSLSPPLSTHIVLHIIPYQINNSFVVYLSHHISRKQLSHHD